MHDSHEIENLISLKMLNKKKIGFLVSENDFFIYSNTHTSLSESFARHLQFTPKWPYMPFGFGRG